MTMNKTGWLIYRKTDAIENRTFIDWFIQEAQEQGLALRLIYREELTYGIFDQQPTILVNDVEVDLPFFAIVRTIEPLLSLHLEKCGIQTFNSSSVSSLCNHKSFTHSALNDLHIPMVDTIFMQKEDTEDIPPMNFPFVVKEAIGRSGKQVYFIKNKQDWDQCRLKLATNDLVVQRANVRLGEDIRVFIIGKEIIGAVKRKSTTDFRANYKLGGSAHWYPLKEEEICVINKIIHSFDFDFVGLDFLVDLQGNLLFNEIEDVVGSRILSAVSDINILQKYIRHIKDHLK